MKEYTPHLWTTEEREIAWAAVTYARRGLKLSISPCIAKSFTFLHKYFAKIDREPAHLYVLMVSSVFLSCKIEDAYRSLPLIFQEIFKSILEIQKIVGWEKIIQTFGPRDYNCPFVTDEEKMQIVHYEIMFLNIVNWNPDIDLPFKYFNATQPVFRDIENDNSENTENICNFVMRDLCLILRNENYLNIHPIVSVAASILHLYGQRPLPKLTQAWVNNIKRNYPEELDLALLVLYKESNRCVPCHSK